MTTYKEAVKSGYDLLVQQYQQAQKDESFNGDFWFAGNTLHTCLNYLVAANQEDSNGGILSIGCSIYKELHKGCWWRDDYSWWGNAFVFAINNRQVLGYDDPTVQSLLEDAKYCFNQLAGNWCDKGYDSWCVFTDHSAGQDQQIAGGTFNLMANHEAMAGRNSVTNEGFWILSQQLTKLDSHNPCFPAYAGMATNWFNAWTTTYPRGQKIGIYNLAGLVLERPLGNKADREWYWSGDQGLMIEALQFNTSALETGVAVRDRMTDANKVLHENMSFMDHSLSGFLADYATGKGICLRSLSRLNQSNPNRPFATMILNTATGVWNTREAGNQFVFNWNPEGNDKEPKVVTGKSDALNNIIMQTSGLEALIAAFRYSPDGVIPSKPTASVSV